MSHTHPSESLDAHAHHHLDPQPSSSDKVTYEIANQRHFDATAYQYNDHPDLHRRAARIGQAMIDTGLFEQGVTTVMDFACGTGLISRVLAAKDPKSIVGVDISQAMVDQYNKVVSDHGIPPEEMRAICIPPYERLQGMTFDVIICGSAYHHLASIDDVTTLLTSTYLNPGGSLLVADLVRGETAHETFPDKYGHLVAHKGGFTEENIRSTFEKAGLKNITFEIIARGKNAGYAVALFLARGDK